jgi:CTP:molybdopterin cytidylyltransferase MocA
MVAGIVLAAGEGTRIGQPKALLETGTPGESFVARACEVLRAGGTERMVVVTAPGLVEPVKALVGGAEVVANPDPARGQLSSLQTALGVLASPEVEAVVVLPVDVPLVAGSTVRELLETWRRSRPMVVRPTRNAGHGHPVVFDQQVLGQIAGLPPGPGAKALVRRHATEVGDVWIDDDGAFRDIDTEEDYRQAFGKLPRRA